jgi:cell division septum initiation protein DivIVA
MDDNDRKLYQAVQESLKALRDENAQLREELAKLRSDHAALSASHQDLGEAHASVVDWTNQTKEAVIKLGEHFMKLSDDVTQLYETSAADTRENTRYDDRLFNKLLDMREVMWRLAERVFAGSPQEVSSAREMLDMGQRPSMERTKQ